MTDPNAAELKTNVLSAATWLRFVYMVVAGVGFYLAAAVGFFIALFQFLAKLFTGKESRDFADLGANIAEYLAQVTRYVTFSTEDKPFPFARFPVVERKPESFDQPPPPPSELG